MERIKRGYADDPKATAIIQRLDAEGREAMRHVTDSPSYVWRDGVLLIVSDSSDADGLARERIYVPHSGTVRLEVLKALHESPVAGHPGRDRMLDLLHRSVYWPKMAKEVKAFVASCDLCQRAKPVNRQAAASAECSPWRFL